MKHRVIGPAFVTFLSSTAIITISSFILKADPALAACSFSPTLGDDTYICDSGTSATGLTDINGNNTLLLPAGGTGTVNGNVTFGAGTDRIEVHSGTIAGNVVQGDGADAFVISGGTVTTFSVIRSETVWSFRSAAPRRPPASRSERRPTMCASAVTTR